MIIKKNIIPNLVKNIQISASQKDSKAVTAGLSILDNISRTEEGKESINKSNAFKNISDVLDNFGTNDQILKMGSKIYSKISKPDDMYCEISNLKAFKEKGDFQDLKAFEKSLVLTSNFILVDENCAILSQTENIELLQNLFEQINSLNISEMPMEYIKKCLLLNKYFMIVFNRILLGFPESIERNPTLLDSITNSIIKCWEWTENIIKSSSENVDVINSFNDVFKEYFCSFVNMFDKSIQLKGITESNLNTIKFIVTKLKNGKKLFELDEKANHSASLILLIADKLHDKDIQTLLPDLFDYLKHLINTSSNPVTLYNSLEVMLTIVEMAGPITINDLNMNGDASHKGLIIPVIMNFMNTKPGFRKANLANLKIIEEIISSPLFLEYHFKNQNKRINFIPAIISVMARHLFKTSTVLKVVQTADNTEESIGTNASDNSNSSEINGYDEELDKNINNLGSKLLEKLVDMADIRRSIKSFKEIATSFSPNNASTEAINNLEQSLLFFFAILRISNYFVHCINDILENVKNLINKEVNYTENLKKDKNLEKDKKTQELINSSNKRLNIMVAILRLIHDMCNQTLLEKENENMLKPIKEIFATVVEVLEKSTDSTNLNVLVSHIKKNVDFLLEKEDIINIITQKTQTNQPQEEKFDNSTLEQVTCSMMNLLRKKIDDEQLANNIITTCVKISNKHPESCDTLVQAGCTRTLLELVDMTTNPELARNILELTKLISLSSEENLTVLGNQNIVEKLHSIHTKFPTDPELDKACKTIANELVKLPGYENILQEIVESNAKELHEIIEEKAMDDVPGKIIVLNNLEKFNAYVTNKKQKEILSDPLFLEDLNTAIKNTIQDKEISDINEKLLQNELSLIKKINEEVLADAKIEDKEKRVEPIIENVMEIMVEKNHYRDVYLSAASILSDYISDEKLFKRRLSQKIDKKFIDSLFDTVDNYLDDMEVSKEVNNILCNLCLQSEDKSNYIVEKGGLLNVIEELKSIVSLNDESSKKIKLNGLKLLYSLLKDNKNMHAFIKAKGAELITNIIKNEVNLAANSPDSSGIAKTQNKNYYLTNDTINLNDNVNKIEDESKNAHIVYCLRIIKENNKMKLNSFTDPRLLRYVLQIIDDSFPNKYLFKKGMKIIHKFLQNDVAIDKNEKKHLVQVITSNVANNITDTATVNIAKSILSNHHVDFIDLELEELIEDKNKVLDTNNFAEFGKFVTYVSTLLELKGEKFIYSIDNPNVLKEFLDYSLDLYSSSLSTSNKNVPCDEGISLGLTKLANNLTKFNLIEKEKFAEAEIDNKLQSIGLYYFNPGNSAFVKEYLKDFKEIYKTVETKDASGEYSESYVNYLQNIYLRSFDFLEHHNNLLTNVDNVNKEVLNKSEENMKEIIKEMVEYYKIDQDQDIKVSTTKNLVSQCLALLSNEKNSSSNLNSSSSNNPNSTEKSPIDETEIIAGSNSASSIRTSSSQSSSTQNSPINKSLWDLLYNVTRKDINNVVCGTEEVVEAIVEKLGRTIEQAPQDNLCREYYQLITTKVENNVELFEKMIDFVQRDFEKNMTQIEPPSSTFDEIKTVISGDPNEEKVQESNEEEAVRKPPPPTGITSSLEIVSNISKFPITSKILFKNENLFNNIKALYLAPIITEESRALLSNILKNFLGNNLNSETLITKHSDLIKGFFNNLIKNKPDLNSEKGRETAKNEIEAFVSLVNDNYKLLSEETKIITNQDIVTAVEIYKDDPILAEKLQNLNQHLDVINKMKLTENITKEKETVQAVTSTIRELFEQQIKELNYSDNETNPNVTETANFRRISQTQKLLTSPTTVIAKISNNPKERMSFISKAIFNNLENTKIKSPLSSKDNCDIPQAIDQLLNSLRKLYNENKSETEDEIRIQRNNIFPTILSSLKLLSVSQDNHKIILEGGLLNFLEKIKQDQVEDKPAPYYLETIDIVKNCTLSENTMQAFLSSPVSDTIIDEVIKLYEQPEAIMTNKDLRQLFYVTNIIFSNICKFKKGFNYLAKKIELEKLLLIGGQTQNIDILTAISEMLINYLENQPKDEIKPIISKNIVEIISKSLNLMDNTPRLSSFALKLVAMNYPNEVNDSMINKLEIIKKINSIFESFSSDLEFVNSVLACLNKITQTSIPYSRDIIDCGLLEKIKDFTKDQMSSEKIIEKISALYKTLLTNNIENIEKFCKNGIVLNIFSIIENYWNKGPAISNSSTLLMHTSANVPNVLKPQVLNDSAASPNSSSKIILNCVSSLDSMTISDKAIAYLSDTRFAALIYDLFDRRREDTDIIKSALHCLGNYLYKEIGGNLKTISFEKVLQLMHSLQKKYYSNSEILINVNYIAGYLIKIVKEKQSKKKLFMIITNSIKMQDWNVPLIIMTLKLMYDVLMLSPDLSDDMFEENMQSLFNLLKVYKDKVDVQSQCYKLLTIYGRNHQFSYTMISSGLIELIKITLESDIYQEKKSGRQLHNSVIGLISILALDTNNAKKISDVLMVTLINFLNNDDYIDDHQGIIKLLFTLTRNKETVEALIQYKGVEAIKKTLLENQSSVPIIIDSLNIFTTITDQGEEYRKMMSNLKIPELVNDVIKSSGYLDKNVEFEGRSLIFAINSSQTKLEEVKELSYISNIRVENPIKPEIKNFLTNGKIVKM